MQKKSSHFAGKIGKQVASDLLTVEDDATNVEGLNASSFDREGVTHRRNIVIEKGILKKFLYNTYTASKDGVQEHRQRRWINKLAPNSVYDQFPDKAYEIKH